MAWDYVDDSSVEHDGATFVIRDMGSDGSCLFQSLALVLALATGVDRSHLQLRTMATDTLSNWALLGVPAWYDTVLYEAPTADRVNDLVAGDWGDATCMLALLANSYPECTITVLNGSTEVDEDEWNLDVSASGTPVPVHQVRILWQDAAHYVALVPETDEALIDPRTASLVALEPARSTGTVSAKLSTISGLSSGLNTSKTSGIDLEIHQIDVGIGDAALVLVKNKGEYVQSILIDSGQFSELVTGYFDHLIGLKRFRPVDIFIASHYDRDHIGAAPTVLGNPVYAAPAAILYDPGVPAKSDSDYAAYLKAFGEPNSVRRHTANLEQPVYELGTLAVRVVAMNGLYRSVTPEYYQSTDEAIEDLVHRHFLDGTATKVHWAHAGLTPGTLFPFDKNDCSMAVLVQFGHFSYYTAGDLNGETETIIAEHVRGQYLAASSGHVCACKLNHHGAHEATSPEVLRQLRPTVALVSCGTPNTHGHPSPLTVDRVAQLNAVYPCKMLVTANLAHAATDKGYPWARPPLPSHVSHQQGSIVVQVPENLTTSKDRHGFLVMSSASGASQLYVCGKRDYRDDLAIVDRVARPQQSQQRKDQSAARKRKRKSEKVAKDQEALDELRDDLSQKLLQVVDAMEPAHLRAQMRGEVAGEVAALAARLLNPDDPDETRQNQKVNTLVKNFTMELRYDTLHAPGNVTKYLRNRK